MLSIFALRTVEKGDTSNINSSVLLLRSAAELYTHNLLLGTWYLRYALAQCREGN